MNQNDTVLIRLLMKRVCVGERKKQTAVTALIYISRLSVHIIDCKSVIQLLFCSSILFASILYFSVCFLSQMGSDLPCLMWFRTIWLSIQSEIHTLSESNYFYVLLIYINTLWG